MSNTILPALSALSALGTQFGVAANNVANVYRGFQEKPGPPARQTTRPV